MKLSKLVLLALFIGCLSSAAFADASFDNQGGNLFLKQQDHSGMYFLTTGTVGSMLTSVTGAGGLNCSPCTGTVNYTTPLATLAGINNITGGATNFGPGGTFNISENTAGVFSGSFTSLTWTYIGTCTSTVSCSTVGQFYEWSLSGTVTGSYMGQQVNGATVQLTTQKMVVKNGQTVFDPFGPNGKGVIGLSGGNSTFPIVPESSTLILFGTGLVGIALFVKRKHFSGLQT
ncbi:MAG TPA: PEP-CTERM sorting domain-containing protein [Terriglobales bacterium]|jgi:hypothetical protein|nr:PEP-CTERM sorting domain-containing protein [Terriglobales bacterium]